LDICDEQIRRNRIDLRSNISFGDHLVNYDSIRKLILDQYYNYSHEYIKVNNTNRPVDDVVQEIRNIIKVY